MYIYININRFLLVYRYTNVYIVNVVTVQTYIELKPALRTLPYDIVAKKKNF